VRFLSLFSGIGGFDLGLERAGMTCVGQVEWEPYCQAVLKHHWPHVKQMGDIRDVKEDSFGPVDLICGGFPCQPFSVAGKQRGKDDNRYLWPEMFRVIRTYRPTWVLGENVPGIVKMALDQVLADLEGEGYAVQAFLIPACGVDAPHRRERVWIVAWNAQSHTGDTLSRIWKRASAIPGRIREAESGTGDVADAPGGENHGRGNLEEATGSRLGINATAVAGGEDVADAPIHGSDARLPEPIQSRQAGWSEQLCGDVPHPGNQGLEEREKQPAQQKFQAAERGDCWPDEAEWFAKSGMGRLAHGLPNRVAQLRALGNAVVPQVVEEIGRCIMAAERKG
jgi:DNA (cytosine-5)-methyltransferase 1